MIAIRSKIERTIKKGRIRSGLFVGSSFASSGNVLFNASLTPNAMAFSATIPIAVGTAPFQKATMPSFVMIERVVNSTDG